MAKKLTKEECRVDEPMLGMLFSNCYATWLWARRRCDHCTSIV